MSRDLRRFYVSFIGQSRGDEMMAGAQASCNVASTSPISPPAFRPLLRFDLLRPSGFSRMAPIRRERTEPHSAPYSIPVSDHPQGPAPAPKHSPASTDSNEPAAATTLPDLLSRVREGLECLLERGGIDARASRQGKVQPKVSAPNEITYGS